MENEKYKEYLPLYRFQKIFLLVQNVFAIIFIFCLIFVPFFNYGIIVKELDIKEVKKFSIFNELQLIFKYYKALDWNIKVNMDLIMIVIGLIGMLFLVIAIIKNIISLIKCIVFLSSQDGSTLMLYDEIRNKNVRAIRSGSNSMNSFIQATIFFVLYYLFRYKLKFNFKSNKTSSTEDSILENFMGEILKMDYFSYLLGVNGLIAIVIAAFVIYIGMMITVAIFTRKIKVKLLRERYELESGKAEKAENNAF